MSEALFKTADKVLVIELAIMLPAYGTAASQLGEAQRAVEAIQKDLSTWASPATVQMREIGWSR